MSKKWTYILIALCAIAGTYYINMNSHKPTTVVNVAAQLIDHLDLTDVEEYSWNQRVTLVVHTESGSVKSSSVLKIKWIKSSRKLHDATPWMASIEGEMPFVELPDSRAVFPLMSNGIDHLPAKFMFGESTINEAILKSTTTIKDSIATCKGSSLMPVVISISKNRLPESIEQFPDDNVCIFSEITSDPVGPLGIIYNELPWLKGVSSSRGRSASLRFPLSRKNSLGHFMYHSLVPSDLVGEMK